MENENNKQEQGKEKEKNIALYEVNGKCYMKHPDGQEKEISRAEYLMIKESRQQKR